MFHNVKEWHDNSIVCYHKSNTMTSVRYLTWHVEYTCYRINLVYILRSRFVCYVGFVLLYSMKLYSFELWNMIWCISIYTVKHLQHINIYWCNYVVNSIHLYLFAIILSNFLIPQLCLNTENNSCSVKYKMMNVPVLYFYNILLPFLNFNCRLFQLFPVD